MKSLVVVAACSVSVIWCSPDVFAREYEAGDLVEVTRTASLQVGRTVVGRVNLGEVFKVEKVNNDWLWINKDGRGAWLHGKNVRRSPILIEREFEFGVPGLPMDIDGRFGDGEGGGAIVVEAREFFGLTGTGRWEGGIIVGGGGRGPHGGRGSASCTVELPEDLSARKIVIGLHHGMPGEHGKGIHSKRSGGIVTISINNVVVHTFTCRNRIPPPAGHNDFWPERLPHLGHDLPLIDLDAKGIKGRKLTIKFDSSPWTCMDLRSISVTPALSGEVGSGGLVVAPAQFPASPAIWFNRDKTVMILNGKPDGPNDTAGSGACKVTVPEGVNRVTIFISHGTQYGQGIHSALRGGTLKVSINGVLVQTFTCASSAEKLNDYYPESPPKLNHQISVDLRAKRIEGRELNIKFEVSAKTCMDFQSMRIAPEFGGILDDVPMPGLPPRDRFSPDPLRIDR